MWWMAKHITARDLGALMYLLLGRRLQNSTWQQALWLHVPGTTTITTCSTTADASSTVLSLSHKNWQLLLSSAIDL
jgi:hypothetical protein